MHRRSTAPSSSVRGSRLLPLWALMAEGTLALAVVVLGAFSGSVVLIAVGLPAVLLSAFCLVVTVLSGASAASATAGPASPPRRIRPSPGSAAPRDRS